MPGIGYPPGWVIVTLFDGRTGKALFQVAEDTRGDDHPIVIEDMLRNALPKKLMESRSTSGVVLVETEWREAKLHRPPADAIMLEKKWDGYRHKVLIRRPEIYTYRFVRTGGVPRDFMLEGIEHGMDCEIVESLAGKRVRLTDWGLLRRPRAPR